MTGCAVPDDCDTVIPQEYTLRQGDRIEVTESIQPGSNIIPVGEECQEGSVIITEGTKLTAGAVSAAVGMGNITIPVFTKTKVLFLTSGRELVLPGQETARRPNLPTPTPISSSPYWNSTAQKSPSTTYRTGQTSWPMKWQPSAAWPGTRTHRQHGRRLRRPL